MRRLLGRALWGLAWLAGAAWRWFNPHTPTGEVETVAVPVALVDRLIDTGRRIRSDPAGHELALAALCGEMAERSVERGR